LVFTPWRRRVGVRGGGIRHVFAQPFAGYEHPPESTTVPREVV